MVQAHDIREHLAEYLAGDVSLASLERWLNSASVRLFVDPADAGFRLLANVNLLISERHDHVIGESELRNSLANLVNNIVVSEAVDNPIPRLKISFSSESQWQTVDRVYALAA